MTPARVETPLVTEIETLVEGVPGFSPIDELFTLSTLVYATGHLPGDVVEVGSWFGRSAIALGAAVRDTHGVVHCIDPFPGRDDWRQNADGSYSFEVEIDGQRHVSYQEQTVWGAPFEQHLAPLYAQSASVYDGFLANVHTRGLGRIVKPHRGTTATFAAQAPPDFRCRVIFLDGDHGATAVDDDLQRLLPYLVDGGWICFDDAFSVYEGVDRAIRAHVLDNPAFDIARQMTRKCFAARRAPRVERD
jgi:predicted O-methyltransferase YrrM